MTGRKERSRESKVRLIKYTFPLLSRSLPLDYHSVPVLLVPDYTSLETLSIAFYPLSPKSDQHQISPYNINAL